MSDDFRKYSRAESNQDRDNERRAAIAADNALTVFLGVVVILFLWSVCR